MMQTLTHSSPAPFDIDFEWVHLQYDGNSAYTETYGFSSSQGQVNLEGIRIRPRGHASRTLMVFMHPAATMQILPVTQACARAGMHVLCAGSRYPKNDSAAILENVVLDLGVYVRHAKEHWGYDKVVLVGWSGGGSLSLFYQSQAENPSVTHTPAGDPVDLVGAGLLPADAVVLQAAHISRARLLLEILDPAIRDEGNPNDRDPALDLYAPDARHRPPYAADFVRAYRAAQLARMRRITAWVKQTLGELRQRPGADVERAFVTHGTLADPRFLDPALDPNDRRPGWCYLGNPATINNAPAGLARYSSLRSWLSQWSVEDTQADGIACAARISVPLLAIENTADDAVPQPHMRLMFEAAGSPDKTFRALEGATHYYAGQPEHLARAIRLTQDWLGSRDLLGD